MSPDSQLDGHPLRRRTGDLYERSLIGPVFYLMAWGLLLLVSDWPWAAVQLVPAGFFGALWWARYRHRLPDPTQPALLARWERGHWAIIHLGSLGWGAVPALVGWVEGKPNGAVLVASLATMAFCTASSQAFATHPAQARLSMVLLFLPGVSTFLARSAELRPTGVTLLVYGFYLLANLRRSAAEYTRQLDTEVELLRSRAEIAQLSRTDALTGLLNRRGHEEAWALTTAAALRQRLPLALLVFDLDHFKQVNDRHGHGGGDACLRHFAALLRQQFRRGTDVLVRLGGEEFVVVVSGLAAAEVAQYAEQLRALVEATPARVGDVDVPLTVSCGFAMHDPADPGSTFKRADEACYAAKQAGRNRVIAA